MDLRLIYLLTGENQNICMIADNDQSIYAFRGAKIEAVMNMRNIFTGMRVHLLNTNYRSTSMIVDASKSLISNNKQLVEKSLRSNNEKGNPIIFFPEKDPMAESARIVKLIELSVKKYGYKYSDIAILYRMNYLSRQIEDALLKYRIPYKIVGGTNFYSRKEIKDIISYFRLIINPNDTIAFSRAINTPKRGLGDKTVEKIIDFAKTNSCNLIEALEQINLTGKAKSSAKDFLDIVGELSVEMETNTPDIAIETMLRITGYIPYIRESEKKNIADDRIENIQELIELATHFESMEELSDNINLDSTIAEQNQDEENCVQLLTMHSSKGLEWNIVIIAGSNEGVIPSYRATTEADYEEERRLMYVAVTRAKKLLFITRPIYTLKQGSYIRTQESRFVTEIDKQYMYRYAE
jgi:DNA helicase-2/ATP-dependent DNA helicase PcrA